MANNEKIIEGTIEKIPEFTKQYILLVRRKEDSSNWFPTNFIASNIEDIIKAVNSSGVWNHYERIFVSVMLPNE